MERLLDTLTTHGLAVLALGLALFAGIGVLRARRRRGTWSFSGIVFIASGVLVSVGALTTPASVGVWLVGGAVAALFLCFVWLVMTTQWSPPLAWVVAAVAFFGLGAWCAATAGALLAEGLKTLASAQLIHPYWLLLLLLVPLIIALSYRSLAGLGSSRRWVAVGLRCLVIALLALALADPRFRQGNDNVTVLFVYDRSLSVPPEYDPNAKDPTEDQRFKRIRDFIKAAVQERGDAHKRDQYGLILFGRSPRLELPPSDAKRFNYPRSPSPLDGNYTDVAAALKLALASFPEGSARRIVLISDGNENLGNAVEQAKLAAQNGVQIDVVPLAAGYRNESEVLVQSVEAPPVTEQGARFPVRVLIRSYNPNTVIAAVQLFQIIDGKRLDMPPPDPPQGLERGEFIIRPGLNSVVFPPPKDRPVGSFTYEARCEPKWVIVDGKKIQAPRGFLQNKFASTHVLATGQRKVLLIEGKPDENEYLYSQLIALGAKAKFKVVRQSAAELAAFDLEKLGLYLLNFDCLILANVPAEALTEDQQEVIRSNTWNQGCGLVMIGGDQSFGAGGWQGTPIEKALPVDCDIKSAKVEQPGGLVLIFHASEALDQNGWQKTIGKLAVKKLGPADMVGILQYDGVGADGTNWHVPFQKVGDAREKILKLVDSMNPGDMPDCNPSFRKAYAALTNAADNLGKKHIIFISDGDHWTADQKLLGQLRAKSISCSTVLVTTHGNDQNVAANMKSATVAPGKFYPVTDPKQLPEIYTKEARIVSQSFIYKDDKGFQPTIAQATGPADKLKNLEPLYGFVRTTPKPGPTVVRGLLGPAPPGQEFPILAFWQYGLGRAVAFTSDARSNPRKQEGGWDRDWAGSGMYRPFWERLVEWSLRATESGALTMTTEFRDGKVRLIIEARDKQDPTKPLTDLRLVGGVTTPSGRVEDAPKLKFEQKNSGRYEAEFKADEAGSYFITARPVRKVINNGKEEDEFFDLVRTGVTVPYSPEFADLESNAPLLDELRKLTGGSSYADNTADLMRAAHSGAIFRAGPPQARSVQPFWYWLVLLAGVLLVFDVAVRRIALEPEAAIAVGRKLWDRLRGRVVPVTETSVLDHLQERRTEAEQPRPEARFDGGDQPVAPITGAEQATAPPTEGPAPAAPPPGVAPEKEQEPDDFAARLLRAKKKSLEDRDKK